VRPDFAIFVLTNGRPDNVRTVETLREHRYTGRMFIVIDDEDPTGPAYRKRYGKDVLTFSKRQIAEQFDEGDNFEDRRSVFYARNACWALAAQVGVRYFMQCDDDYSGFYVRTDAAGLYGSFRAEFLDDALDAMIAYLAAIPALTIAMSQGGDHLQGWKANPLQRKAMNTFLCDTERPFRFVGRINEDVNTYTSLGRAGELFLTIPNIQVNQSQTQTNSGGMTELYRDAGTYLKSFYSVMYCPSAVRIHDFKRTEQRIHHRVNWSRATAQIIRESYRKERPDARLRA